MAETYLKRGMALHRQWARGLVATRQVSLPGLQRAADDISLTRRGSPVRVRPGPYSQDLYTIIGK